MDVSGMVGGNNVTIDGVKSSPVRQGVILSGGAMAKTQDGKDKMSLLVEFNGKQIQWMPNKTSLKFLMDKYGKESNAWIGKVVTFEIGIVNSKECVIGKPV